VAAASLRLARRLALSPAGALGARHGPVSEHFPGAHLESDDDLAVAAGNISSSIFHPVGTCRMGRESFAEASRPRASGAASGAVVDGELRVLGVGGLRVADAAIMPTITSGNTNSPTMAIASKAAALILAAHSAGQ